MKPRLIIHGGAWNIPPERREAHLTGLREAAVTAAALLEEGGTSLDTVEAAVRHLEADPTFDAGRGSFLNDQGEVELDAMIMDGQTLDFGAVAALQNVMHPVSVARRVMMSTDHCLLVGRGAQRFAEREGFQLVPPEALLTERERAYYEQVRSDPAFKPHHPFSEGPMGTVGAVALDHHGNLAAATSTGGTPQKLSGRVGDTPLCGAGTYADNESGAVSTTGWGETIMKVLLAKTACDLMRTLGGDAAGDAAIRLLEERVGGLGGLIGITRDGDYVQAWNTPHMAWARLEGDGSIQSGI